MLLLWDNLNLQSVPVSMGGARSLIWEKGGGSEVTELKWEERGDTVNGPDVTKPSKSGCAVVSAVHCGNWSRTLCP